MLGTLIGGLVVAAISRSDDRWKLWAPALMSALAAPTFAYCLFAPSFPISVATLGVFSLLVGFHLGPIFTITQSVAKPSMRAFAAATVLLTATCFGQGVGPLVVGAITDSLRAELGADAIRYSLLAAAATSFAGALFFVAAARFIKDDIERASSPNA
jgi:MFS family permease